MIILKRKSQNMNITKIGNQETEAFKKIHTKVSFTRLSFFIRSKSVKFIVYIYK